MMNELKNTIIEDTVDFLLTTEGGLTEKDAKQYREYISSHANDYIRSKYDGLTEEQYKCFIEESVKEYHKYDE